MKKNLINPKKKQKKNKVVYNITQLEKDVQVTNMNGDVIYITGGMKIDHTEQCLQTLRRGMKEQTGVRKSSMIMPESSDKPAYAETSQEPQKTDQTVINGKRQEYATKEQRVLMHQLAYEKKRHA